MTTLPQAPLARVLDRVATIWAADAAPHHVVYGMTGAGKSTLIKALLSACPYARTLILDPKPHPDPVWDEPGDPDRWGTPVCTIEPMFGARRDGGGPARLRYRLTGTPDRDDTARRFAGALAIVQAEGHCVLVLDDVREITRQLRLGLHVDSVLNLGRSANVLAILSATETSYVSGRSQAGQVWVGHTTGLDAAKAGAGLLGWRGRDAQDAVAAVGPHQWIYSESQPGSAGPVLVTS
jgi:energy-coupling factor transporter ATP-binding protein EcfA2